MRRIIVLNQKGGVGKTTTVANLGACLAESGRKVLLVDVDPQAHLSVHFGLEVGRGEPSLYTLLRGEHRLDAVTRETKVEGVHVVPANIDLSGLPVELSDTPGRLFLLRKALTVMPGGFDYLIMDSPPSLGLLTVNALCAAGEVLIPLQCEFFALQGLTKLLQTVRRVRRTVNRQLAITGVLAVMHDSRTRLAQEIFRDIEEHFGSLVFRTVVHKNIRLAEAPGFGMPIISYDPECRGAQDYRALAQEVIAKERHVTDTIAAAAPQVALSPARPSCLLARPAPMPARRGDDASIPFNGRPGAERRIAQ
jgi:chromosome partitioning protein